MRVVNNFLDKREAFFLFVLSLFCQMYTTVISLVLIVIDRSYGISSPLIPFTNYNYSISMQENVSDLWWNVNKVEQEILFEFHVKTIGWIAFGISPGT